jgi:outer membrane protein OmpA-like peptidoglycan-associated protein
MARDGHYGLKLKDIWATIDRFYYRSRLPEAPLKLFPTLRFAMMAGFAVTLALTSGCSMNPERKGPIVQDVPEGADAQFDGAIKIPTNDNVQVYSLDDQVLSSDTDTAAAGAVRSMPPASMMTGDGEMLPPGGPAPLADAASPLSAKGVPYAKDSSVEVFPFDDQASANGFPATDALMPQLPPPSSATGGFASPFADNGWGADRTDSNKIFFANGSSHISASGQDVINQVATNAGSGELVRVEGHASKRAAARDPVKRHAINLKMSMQRAVKVSQSLMKKGVPAENIKTTAWGDTQPPMLTDPSMDEETASRRVEIFTQPK